ncbi:MAG: response regulator [Undibacterium sp.]|nr:response regulator [Opitutaceae bacterium]
MHHHEALAHDMPLEDVHRLFRERAVDFFALVRDGRVTGLCSRTRVGFLLGSRFGFALNSRSPAHSAQVAHPLVFTSTTPLRPILDQALGRPTEEFHEDVVLVDEAHRLIGLIPVQALARLQTRLVGEQITALRDQHEAARLQNLELFQSNHALRQAQGLYRALFESNATGVALLDLHGEVQAHNQRLAELLGRSQADERQFSLVALITEREHMAFRQLLLAHEAQGPVPGAREFHFELGERGTRLLRISMGWIRETSQICACVDDMTEQRAIERHLQGQEKQLLLDTLVGGIAHELNNKLTPVLGFAQLLDLEASERGRGYVGYISRSVIEAASIIRQLLQLSKPETGQPQLVNLGSLVEESVTMLKFQLREARVALHTQSPPEPVIIFADPSQLKQVVMNLIINALHAMARNTRPRLALTVSRKGGFGCLEVSDNGSGIAPEVIERIFDPFFTTKGPDKGSGLGLSICQSLVRSLGGKITVNSTPGCGARFSVSLPLAASDGAATTHSAAPFAARARVDLAAGQRVLVVEDDDVVRKFLQEALRAGFGCRVDAVVDGAEALQRAAVQPYVLVISDVRMPGMNGPEFYRRLCELRSELAGRFVFVTGHEGEDTLVELMGQVEVPLLAKPFTMQRLHEICGPILGRTGGEARSSNCMVSA